MEIGDREIPRDTVTRFTIRDAIVIVVVLAALTAGLWLRIGPDIGGTTVVGEVIGKHEAIEMPLDDTWRHLFEISYRFQPDGARFPTTGHHPVDVALYDRLRVGSAVNVRYRRVPVIGALDSALEETSWWSRTPSASESARELVEVIAFCAAAALGGIAYRRRSRLLTLVAVTVGAIVASSVLLLGFLIFPILFWIWSANRGQGYGWVLLWSSVFTTVALYYSIPRPKTLAPGRRAQTMATVRGVKTVDRIFAASSAAGESMGGQRIRHPFQMVDLEFTSPGASEAVHALDLVDLGSVPGLSAGATVPIEYAVADPRAGRMLAGTRRYARDALIYVLELTFGVGAVLASVVFPVVYLAKKVVRSSSMLSIMFDPTARARLVSDLSALPADHLRRKTLERLDRPRSPDKPR
jgi:hypothetical protein